MTQCPLHVIAHMHSDFPSKFGIPRQSGLVPELLSSIVFEPTFRDPTALRGLEEFSHIWLIWGFSRAEREGWSPSVRPPRLGGNKRMGVFATRAPFRPNPIGLSCVRLVRMEQQAGLGTVLIVSGADLMDGTPLYDIKPYLPYADCQPDATGGFSDSGAHLNVEIPEPWRACLPPGREAALYNVLAHDPRPSYQEDADRVYGMAFAGYEIKFRVQGDTLTVCGIYPDTML